MRIIILIFLILMHINAKLIRTTSAIGLFVDKTQSGTVLYDTQTGLYWQDDATAISTQNYWGWLWTSDPTKETQTWWDYLKVNKCPPIDGANKECLCNPDPYMGYWRVPTYNELNSIVDRSRNDANPFIKKEFKNAINAKYWTSTTYAGDDTKAWYIDFSNGGDGVLDKDTILYVRCVH